MSDRYNRAMGIFWKSTIVIALIVGLAISIDDYRQWRRAELANYGQGSQNAVVFEPALPLDKPYSNYDYNFRIKYPAGWQVVEGVEEELVRFVEPNAEATVTVLAQTEKRNLTDFVVTQSTGITRDPEHIKTATADFTILTWADETTTTQKAFTKKGSTIIIVTATCASTAWLKYAQTFAALYQSGVWF